MTTKEYSIVKSKLLDQFTLEYLKKHEGLINFVKRETERQLRIGGVGNCACKPDETTGTTTVRCCNICGKPAESFWFCG